jgi:type I site-specific restriction endonuclease
MIATGTDLRPLEALTFLRDVKSALYFEQMMGRGARTISPAALRQVTPDAEAKTRFIVIDAVGVAEGSLIASCTGSARMRSDTAKSVRRKRRPMRSCPMATMMRPAP